MNVTRTVYALSCSSWAWDTLPSTIDNRLRLAYLTPNNNTWMLTKAAWRHKIITSIMTLLMHSRICVGRLSWYDSVQIFDNWEMINNNIIHTYNLALNWIKLWQFWDHRENHEMAYIYIRSILCLFNTVRCLLIIMSMFLLSEMCFLSFIFLTWISWCWL